MLQTMNMLLGVFYDRVRVVRILYFLQIQMLVIINMFRVKQKEMCYHNVLMQRLYNEVNLHSVLYSDFGLEEYLSDDEGEDLEEDGMKKFAATVPVDYVYLVFEFVLMWHLMLVENAYSKQYVLIKQ